MTNDTNDANVTLSRDALLQAIYVIEYALFEEDGHLNVYETAANNAEGDDDADPFLFDADVKALTDATNAWRAMREAYDNAPLSGLTLQAYNDNFDLINAYPVVTDD